MFIFLSILFFIVTYIVGAGATYGYAKYRWPFKGKREWNPYVGAYQEIDENKDTKAAAAILWPFYWMFIWPFTKTNEVTFSHIEKNVALQVAKNKARVADLHATRVELEASNQEVEAAEVELEKEINNV